MAEGYVWLDGTDGRLDGEDVGQITDLEVIMLLSRPDANWHPTSGTAYIVAQRDDDSQTQSQFAAGFQGGASTFTPALLCYYSAGNSTHTFTAISDGTFAADDIVWWKFTRDSSDGSSACFYSTDSPSTAPDSVSWTASGTGSGTSGALKNVATVGSIGGAHKDTGSVNQLNGNIYYVRVKDTADGGIHVLTDFRTGDWSDLDTGHDGAEDAEGTHPITWTASGTEGTDWWYAFQSEFGYYQAITGSADITSPSATHVPGNTSVFDLRMFLRLPDFTPASDMRVLSKYNPSGTSRSYYFGINTGGHLTWTYSATGSGTLTNHDRAPTTTPVDNEWVWLRWLGDPDNGSNSTFKMFYGGADPAGPTWDSGSNTQLATASSIGGAKDAEVQILAFNTNNYVGDVAYIQLLEDDVAQFTLDFRTGDWSNLDAGLPDAEGNAWTAQGTGGTNHDLTPWPTIWVA